MAQLLRWPWLKELWAASRPGRRDYGGGSSGLLVHGSTASSPGAPGVSVQRPQGARRRRAWIRGCSVLAYDDGRHGRRLFGAGVPGSAPGCPASPPAPEQLAGLVIAAPKCHDCGAVAKGVDALRWLCDIGAMVASTAMASSFLCLRRHGDEVGEGRAGHTSLSQFGDSDSEGVLRLLPVAWGRQSTGSTGKAAAADTGWTLSCMGFRAYGEGFTRSLGLSKAPLSLCGVFFLVYNLDLLVKR